MPSGQLQDSSGRLCSVQFTKTVLSSHLLTLQHRLYQTHRHQVLSIQITYLAKRIIFSPAQQICFQLFLFYSTMAVCCSERKLPTYSATQSQSETAMHILASSKALPLFKRIQLIMHQPGPTDHAFVSILTTPSFQMYTNISSMLKTF